MAAEWFYTSNRQQMGPVSWGELCRLADDGRLRPTDLVWKDGMADWAPARTSGAFSDDRRGRPRVDDRPRSEERSRSTERSRSDERSRTEDRPSRRDDDDDRPRRRSGRDDEGYDDDFDRIRRRRRRSSGMPAGLKVGLIVGGVVLGLAIVAGILVLVLNSGIGGGPRDIPPQGLTFTETLRRNDTADARRGTPARFFTVNFVANSTYVIDHRSVMFDTYLRLEDSNGVNIAEDDDSGGGLNARIVFRPTQSGAYRIIATTFDGRVGNFVLTVRKN